MATTTRPATGTTTRPATGTTEAPRGDWDATGYGSDYGPSSTPRP